MTVQKPQSEAQIAAMFDRVAPRYDLLNRLLSGRQDQRWRQHLIARIPNRIGGSLLDVATGTGDVLFAARAAHPEYSDFVGVDISKGMLDRARQKLTLSQSKNSRTHSRVLAGAPTLKKPTMTFHNMSATELDLRSNTFDCVTISFGLRNVVDRHQGLNELIRVLKPGGTLLILEFFLPKNGLPARLFQFYFHKILPKIAGAISDPAAYQYLPQSVGSFYTTEELRRAIYDLKCTVEEINSFMFGSCRLVRAVKS